MPYGVYRYNEIIDECYIISKLINTSYIDLMEISVRERDRMLELINEENKREQERIENIKRKSKH